jgi:hypothetical protein
LAALSNSARRISGAFTDLAITLYPYIFTGIRVRYGLTVCQFKFVFIRK